MYPEDLVGPMRQELVALGFVEIRTSSDVERELNDRSGTALVAVNSVCGCAAGNFRPGIAQALQHVADTGQPDKLLTAFAGNDKEAVQVVRSEYLTGIPASSPCAALLKDGEVVAMLERKDIEGHSPEQVSARLISAFEEHC